MYDYYTFKTYEIICVRHILESMKQSEKLDLILRYLYDRRDDNKEYSIYQILEDSGIETNVTEVLRISKKLEEDGLIYLHNLSNKLRKAKITSKGVEYCEGDSYSNQGQSVTNNYHIAHNNESTVIINSSQVSINQSDTHKALDIINKIRSTVEQENVKLDQRREIYECLTEIEESVKRQKSPRFAVKGLISLISDISSVVGLGLSLAQLLGVSG